MEKIASFTVDHTKFGPGMYVSRVDGDIVTYDVRMKKPNSGDYLDVAGAHTIEHLFATYVRNTEFGDNIIYFGPMGCRTGFYFLTRSLSDSYCIQLIKDAFAFIADFWGSIPGAAMSECGNWRDHNLLQAKEDAKQFLEIIQDWTKDDLKYPTKDEN